MRIVVAGPSEVDGDRIGKSRVPIVLSLSMSSTDGRERNLNHGALGIADHQPVIRHDAGGILFDIRMAVDGKHADRVYVHAKELVFVAFPVGTAEKAMIRTPPASCQNLEAGSEGSGQPVCRLRPPKQTDQKAQNEVGHHYPDDFFHWTFPYRPPPATLKQESRPACTQRIQRSADRQARNVLAIGVGLIVA